MVRGPNPGARGHARPPVLAMKPPRAWPQGQEGPSAGAASALQSRGGAGTGAEPTRPHKRPILPGCRHIRCVSLGRHAVASDGREDRHLLMPRPTG